MSQCVNVNYYRYRTFPFAFKQKFGPNSNLIDSKPKQQNEIVTFALGFVLTALVAIPLFFRKKRSKTSKSDGEAQFGSNLC